MIARRRLGTSELMVSELSLGSWRTYERISHPAGVAVMRKAQELGINFLDDARYNDETGEAPMKTGYSEVIFGQLFRDAGWKRDEVVIANKLWWEFWPDQNAVQEIDASLRRMGLEHIDLAYAERLPADLSVRRCVEEVGALIEAGKIRAWGVLNWTPVAIAEAAGVCGEMRVPAPCAAQLPYSLVMRSAVENPEMDGALDAAGMSVVASYTLAGGALTGKYDDPAATGRINARIDGRDYSQALAAGTRLKALAAEVGATPAALAIAFALSHPRVASVLFGATSPEQVADNAAAVEVKERLDEPTMKRLRTIGS
ncbi:MAG TPA: aldo/keto reductase [Candidatus Dormibacteraeota bacterium]|nr:aldo/keto reductase [Candidatus Dormibacteraeota bacterium]